MGFESERWEDEEERAYDAEMRAEEDQRYARLKVEWDRKQRSQDETAAIWRRVAGENMYGQPVPPESVPKPQHQPEEPPRKHRSGSVGLGLPRRPVTPMKLEDMQANHHWNQQLQQQLQQHQQRPQPQQQPQHPHQHQHGHPSSVGHQTHDEGMLLVGGWDRSHAAGPDRSHTSLSQHTGGLRR